MTAEDAILVRGCLKGDAGAIQALVDRYQSDVFGLCVRLLRHRHDAEDVTQEVFLRIFRSLKRWDGQRPLKPWIMSIAVNRCRTWLVQRAKRPELVDYLCRDRWRPGLKMTVRSWPGKFRRHYRNCALRVSQRFRPVS